MSDNYIDVTFGGSGSGDATSLQSVDVSATAPEDGNVLAYNQSNDQWKPVSPSLSGFYNVKNYGATGDGSTDDSAAIQAAIDAMVYADSVAEGGTLFFPQGVYRCSSDINVWRQIKIVGVSGGMGNSLSRIEFDAGKQLIFWKRGYKKGGSSDGSEVSSLDIWSTKLTLSDWASSHAYSVGDKVKIDDVNYVYLECIKAGTSNSSAPVPGYDPDFTNLFENNRAYALGEIVRGTNEFGAFFEVTTAGTSGGSEPTWDTTAGHTTTSGTVTFTARNAISGGYWIQDNTVVWAPKVHAGILMMSRAAVKDCYIYNTTNAGVYIRGNSAGYPLTNANGWYLERVRVQQCGIGIMCSGGDSNVGTAISCDVESAGYGFSDNGGVGIYDASFLGCTWIGCQVANASDYGGSNSIKGGSGASYSVFNGCYTENYGISPTTIQSDIRYPAIVIGGDHGAGFTTGSNALRLFAHDSRNFLFKTLVSGSNYIWTYLGSNDGQSVLRYAYESDIGYMSLGHLPSATGGFGGGGQWWGFNQGASALSGKVALVFAGENAQFPSGQTVGSYDVAWFPKGRIHLGPKTSDPPSIGLSDSAPASGYYVKGSITINNNPTNANDVIGWRCTTTGSPGTWEAINNSNTLAYNNSTVIEADSATQVTNSADTIIYDGNSYGTITELVKSVQTTDATETSLYTWTITDEAVSLVDVAVTAIKSDGTSGASYKRSMTFRRDGGTVSAIGTVRDNQTDEDASGWDVNIDNSTSTGRVRVTGAAATTIRWLATIRIQTVTGS